MNASSLRHRTMARASGVLALVAAIVASTMAPAGAAEQDEPAPFVELVAASGQGRLYTADPVEVRNAPSFGLRRVPGQIGFLRRRPFNGSTPLYRLKPSASATAWLFTASATERDRLIAQRWVYEGVAGHISTGSGPGLVRLWRFTNGREWRLASQYQ